MDIWKEEMGENTPLPGIKIRPRDILAYVPYQPSGPSFSFVTIVSILLIWDSVPRVFSFYLKGTQSWLVALAYSVYVRPLQTSSTHWNLGNVENWSSFHCSRVACHSVQMTPLGLQGSSHSQICGMFHYYPLTKMVKLPRLYNCSLSPDLANKLLLELANTQDSWLNINLRWLIFWFKHGPWIIWDILKLKGVIQA